MLNRFELKRGYVIGSTIAAAQLHFAAVQVQVHSETSVKGSVVFTWLGGGGGGGGGRGLSVAGIRR